MGQANVRSVEKLTQTIKEVGGCLELFGSRSEERLGTAHRLKEETEREERLSSGMLEAARAAEAAANAALIAAEATLASLIAASVGNPALALEIPAAAEAVSHCKQALELAVRHREIMERRFELARNCLGLASANFEQLTAELNSVRVANDAKTAQQLSRLAAAFGDLGGYASRTSSPVTAKYEKWEKYEAKPKEPIRPDEIRLRLNPDRNVCMGLLAMLCAADEKFRVMVNGYRAAGKTDDVILKIRKNMAGRLAEEIVKGALAPFGESVDTQARTYFDDGTYTKTDLIVHKLIAPIILGRGEGMGAREGGDLGVEVKAGSGSYILNQKAHLVFQAKGHALCQVSCTICTRDIVNINDTAEEGLRRVMRESGSPMLGMLPFKSELDSICIDFVFGE